MSDFKEFLGACIAGAHRRELFLFKNKLAVEGALLDLFNEANELRLYPIHQRTNERVLVNFGIAKFGIAYLGCSYRYAGMPWHAIHGLDLFDNIEDARGDKERLRAFIRPEVKFNVSE